MRRVFAVVIALAIALGLLSTAASGSTAAAAAANPLGGTASVVYFPQTGHHIQGAFLNYWLDNGGLNIFGYPLTEEFGQNGLVVQYFQRARFELHKTSSGSQVLLGLLGNQITNNKSTGPFTPFPKGFTYKNNTDHWYFPQTGHFLNYGFLSYWQDNGGAAIFGYPISEEFNDNGLTVQYFQRARFEYHPNNPVGFKVQLGLLGTQMAAMQHVSTNGVAKRSEAATWPNISTLPAKWIEIDLSGWQTLTAWQGNTQVFSTPVSGGVAAHPTPTGVFYIQTKLRYDDMTNGIAGGDDYYYLPNVPYVMYFYTGGYAIHGTYWHHNFGNPMSHGCVNLPTPAAEWMYNWAPVGTPIWIHW